MGQHEQQNSIIEFAKGPLRITLRKMKESHLFNTSPYIVESPDFEHVRCLACSRKQPSQHRLLPGKETPPPEKLDVVACLMSRALSTHENGQVISDHMLEKKQSLFNN